MGFKLADLFVEITGHDGGLQRTLASAHHGLDALARSSAGALGQLGSGFNRIGGQAALLLGGAAVAGGGAMAIGLYKAAHAASDLSETINKVDVVFGPAGEIVKAEAQKMADAFGYPKTVFLDAAASIGLIGKAAGQTKDQAAVMGANFSKLAADVASFYNVPLDEALQAIRSGLVGEAEPLRRYGVLLSEAAVQQEAARMGIAKMGDELSEAQKVQARSSLITKQLGDAQGDLARTADGAANKQREAWGRLENAAADLGDALLPVFTELLSGVADAMGGIDEWVNENKSTISEWATAVGEVFSTVGIVYRNFGSVAQIVGLTVQEKLINIGEMFEWLVSAAGPTLSWFADNWPSVITDTFNAVWSIIENTFTNIKNLFAATFEYIMNPSGGFHFEFKGLLDGFESTISQLPDIARPHLTSLQADIDAVGERMATAELDRAEKKAKAAAELARNAAQGAAAGDEGPDPKKEKKEKKAESSSLEEFAKHIQAGAFNKDQIAKDQLAVQKDQLAAAQQTAADVAKMAARTVAGLPALAL